MTVNIEYEAERRLDIPYEEIIRKVVLAALDYEECPYEADVSVVLTDNASIREINHQTRGIDRETDVLSFPMNEYPAPGDFSELESLPDSFHPETGELLLGDIMISVDKVFSQAEAYGHSTVRELAFLVAHSMLHLLGYDHMEDTQREDMERRQREILDAVGITR